MLRDAATTYSGASSVHITGSSTVNTETDAFDLFLAPQGGLGTITANGARADVVIVRGDIYVRGRQFWSTFAGARAAAAIGDRWVHFAADNPAFSKQLKLLTITGVSGAIETIAAGGGIAKGSSVHEDGVLALKLTGRDGSLDVALDGRPYPVRLHYTDSGNAADLHFGDYDKPFTAPSAPIDVIDVPNAPTG